MSAFPAEVMAVPLRRVREGNWLEVQAEWGGDTYALKRAGSACEDAIFGLLEHKARVVLMEAMGFPVVQVDESGKHRRVRKRPDGTYETLT